MRSLRLVREFDRYLLCHVTRPMSSETGAGDDDDGCLGAHFTPRPRSLGDRRRRRLKSAAIIQALACTNGKPRLSKAGARRQQAPKPTHPGSAAPRRSLYPPFFYRACCPLHAQEWQAFFVAWPGDRTRLPCQLSPQGDRRELDPFPAIYGAQVGQ